MTAHKKLVSKLMETDLYKLAYFTPTIRGFGGAFSSVTYVSQVGCAIVCMDRAYTSILLEWSAAAGSSGDAEVEYSGLNSVLGFSTNSSPLTPANIALSNIPSEGQITPSGTSNRFNFSLQLLASGGFVTQQVGSFNSGSFNKKILINEHKQKELLCRYNE